jgi:hypothetical protein
MLARDQDAQPRWPFPATLEEEGVTSDRAALAVRQEPLEIAAARKPAIRAESVAYALAAIRHTLSG